MVLPKGFRPSEETKKKDWRHIENTILIQHYNHNYLSQNSEKCYIFLSWLVCN